jgi:Leucine-rich repeat (LRR) protein
MIKIFLGLIVSSFLFAGDLANKKEFMKMCENPTPSQKITFEALAKDNRVKLDKDMCAYLYSRTGTSGFSSANADTNDITDLSPLQFFLDLETLRLYDNKVKDISILKHLTKLKELNLSGNPVSNLSPLKDLKHLEDLNLYSTQVSDLSPINNIKTLKSLSYSGEKADNIINIQQIKDLVNLEYLGILFAETKNFYLINNFTKLTHFNPDDSVTNKDMNSLTNLKELKRLDLDDAKFITNIDFVLNFPNMQELFLNKTNIKDISVLKKLSNLTILNISNTQVTDASGIMVNTDVNPMYLVFRADNTPLKWCSPKNTQDIRNGKSCFNEDGTLKPFYKRWLGL